MLGQKRHRRCRLGRSVLKIFGAAWALSCLGVTSSAALAQPTYETEGVEAVRLLDLLAAVREGHPELKQEKASLDGVRAEILAASAAYRPSLSFRGEYGYTERDGAFAGGVDFDEEIEPRLLSVEVNQILYDGGRRSLDLFISTSGVKAAEARLKDRERVVIERVIERYVDLAKARAALSRQEAITTLFEQQLSGAEKRLRAGQAVRSEIAQLEARLAEARAEAATSRQTFELARSELSVMAGASIGRTAPVPDAAVPDITVDEARLLARKVSPLIRSLKIDLKIAQMALGKAARENWPTVTLFARANRTEEQTATIDEDNSYAAGVSLNVPIYRGGAGTASRRRAAAAVREARYALRDAELRVDTALMTAWARYQSSSAVRVSQEQRVAFEKEAYEAVDRGRGLGNNSVTDVSIALERLLAAEIALAEAQLDEKQAAMSVNLLIMDLDSFAGQLSPGTGQMAAATAQTGAAR